MADGSTDRLPTRTPIDADTWRRLEPLLDAALDLPEDRRSAWLDALPPGQADLRRPLCELLAVPDGTLGSAAPRSLLGELGGLDAPARRAGDPIGPYRLIDRLGAGGMGEVWLAERADGLMQRQVALKLPFAWAGGLAARLGRERNILAALVHPHIAQLYDAGIAVGGQPWLALEVVQGRRIDEWADAQGLDVPARLRLALQAVRAVAHAHAQLVVHRDLKPSNLLVDGQGQVKLLDFGIAKLLDAEAGADLTEQGARPMTPGYASPEQVAGLAVGTRSDVYALGVLLYELLAGVSPYGRQASRGAVEAAVLRAEPKRPSDAAADPARRKALRGDLDTIVLHALAKHPEDRYATADALADDIERHLAHRPLRARPDGRWTAAKKLLRRHAVAFAAGGAVTLALLAGAAVALWQGLQARAERERAEQVKAFVVGILKDASPYEGRDVARLSAADLVLQAEERLRHARIRSPEVRAELGVLIGEALLTSSRLDEAERQLAGTAADARSELGEDDPLALRARVAAAQTLRLRGRVADQHRVLDALLPLVRRQGDRDPLLLMETLAQLALNAGDRGAYGEAEALAAEGHELVQRRLSDDSPEAAGMAILRALTHLQARHFELARQVGEDGLRRARAVYAGLQTHPRLAEALLVQGRALAETGDLQAGVAHLAEAVQMAQRMYAAGDVPLALARQNLASYQLETGDAEPAVQAAGLALAGLVAAMPAAPAAESPVVASTRATLGAALLAAGRPADALAELDTARTALAAAVPPGHELVLVPAVNAALATARMGQGAEALSRLDALAPHLADGKAQESTRGRALLARATAERQLGRPADALATLQPLLARADGPMRVQRDRMRALVEAGWAHLALGRRMPAAASFREALLASLQLESVDTALRAQARRGLGVAGTPP